jgi:hypothetical protein
MYSGNHSPVHPLDTLMQAADRLRAAPDFCFVFCGGGSEFARVKKWAAGNTQVLCLPYQPLDQLSASLSAADLHVVVMGNAMLGLVHPCKIYNIFAVGAPLVYIGPECSHITEARAAAGGTAAFISVRHGEAERLAQELSRWKKTCERSGERPSAPLSAFSAKRLLPQLVEVLEETSATRK